MFDGNHALAWFSCTMTGMRAITPGEIPRGHDDKNYRSWRCVVTFLLGAMKHARR